MAPRNCHCTTSQIAGIALCVVLKFLIAGYPFFCVSFLGALYGCVDLPDGSNRMVLRIVNTAKCSELGARCTSVKTCLTAAPEIWCVRKAKTVPNKAKYRGARRDVIRLLGPARRQH